MIAAGVTAGAALAVTPGPHPALATGKGSAHGIAFNFSAVRTQGTRGDFTFTHRSKPRWKVSGRATCLRIHGDTATIGGKVTSASGKRAPARRGRVVVFVVRDGPDRISALKRRAAGCGTLRTRTFAVRGAILVQKAT